MPINNQLATAREANTKSAPDSYFRHKEAVKALHIFIVSKIYLT